MVTSTVALSNEKLSHNSPGVPRAICVGSVANAAVGVSVGRLIRELLFKKD